MQITIDRQGQQFGPYTMDEVKQYLAEGTLLPTDLAWHDGLAGWVPLSELAGNGAMRAPASSGGKRLKIALMGMGVSALAAIIILIVLPMFKGGDDKKTASDANATAQDNATAPGAWESMPDGGLIVGGADIILQLKVGDLFKSPLVQQQLKDHAMAGKVISRLQQLAGIGPAELHSLTFSASGFTALPNGDTLSGEEKQQAIRDALDNGDIQFGIVLKTSKAVDKSELEKNLSKIVANDKSLSEKIKGSTKYFVAENSNPDEPSICLYIADDTTVVAGSEKAVLAHIDNPGSVSARTDLDFLDAQQQIIMAVKPGPSFLRGKIDDVLANIPPNAPPSFKKLGDSLKKIEIAALSGSTSGGGLTLTASAHFSDGNSATDFANNFNALITDPKKIPDAAPVFLMLQSMGIQIPQAISTQNQAKLEFTLPKQALEGLITQTRGGHSESSKLRWAGMSQFSQLPQWPNYDYIIQHLAEPDQKMENAMLDLRGLNTQISPSLFNPNLITPQERQRARLAGTRIDYFDNPQGTRAIRLYFRPQTQQLIAIEWHEAAPEKIGPPGPMLKPPPVQATPSPGACPPPRSAVFPACISRQFSLQTAGVSVQYAQ